MQYLNASEYGVFGLQEETSDALVTAASAMIDAFCKRPSLGVTQYTERLRFSRHRQTLQLTYLPVAATGAVVSLLCRYGREYGHDAFLEAAQVFQTPGTWVDVDVSTVAVGPGGSLELPCNVMGLLYTDAEVTYTAGYTDVPVPVKVACAQIVKNAEATPALNVKKQSMDSLQMEYFSATLLSDDTRQLLQPFVAERASF